MDVATQDPEGFDELRPLLFAIAYRMVGAVGEAEDLVQESYLRLHRALDEGTAIRSLKAWLSTTVTRLAIDHLRSARVRRERYVGVWLPEPILTDAEPDAGERLELAESLSMAFLVLLETLSPVERAVFLLHDVFGYGYDEVAEIVGKSEENARQIATRARRHVDARRPRFEASAERRDELTRRFIAAVEVGDTRGLVDLLAADVVMQGDGGGKAPALAEPVRGSERVARFLAGLARQAATAGIVLRPARVNGQPGLVARDRRGGLVSVMSLDLVDGRVQAIRSVVNPDKLRHLGPVGDLTASLRAPRDG